MHKPTCQLGYVLRLAFWLMYLCCNSTAVPKHVIFDMAHMVYHRVHMLDDILTSLAGPYEFEIARRQGDNRNLSGIMPLTHRHQKTNARVN